MINRSLIDRPTKETRKTATKDQHIQFNSKCKRQALPIKLIYLLLLIFFSYIPFRVQPVTFHFAIDLAVVFFFFLQNHFLLCLCCFIRSGFFPSIVISFYFVRISFHVRLFGCISITKSMCLRQTSVFFFRFNCTILILYILTKCTQFA